LKEPKDHDAAVLMIMTPHQNHLQVYWIALEQDVSNSSLPKKKLLLWLIFHDQVFGPKFVVVAKLPEIM
jgi:hypothetical protein